MKAKQREGLIALISELHKHRVYMKETLFIAIGLCDRFLSQAANALRNKPLDLVQLGTVSLLLAAKLNQPLSPSFNQMILLLDDEYRTDPTCKQ